MTESKPPAAPDGEGPYENLKSIPDSRPFDKYCANCSDKESRINGYCSVACEECHALKHEVNDAWREGFTAGQQHRSDGGEVAAPTGTIFELDIFREKLERKSVERRVESGVDDGPMGLYPPYQLGFRTAKIRWSDELKDLAAELKTLIDNCQERREGEPRRWVAKHTDQHVVRPEPFERGMNFVVQSREAADRLAEILNAQPAPPDLVDAARGMLVAYHGITYAGFGDRTLDDWNRPHAAADTLTAAAGLSTREVFEAAEANHAAALQNTPQPDESEAVKLLRDLVKAIDTYGEQRIQYWPETVAAVKFLSNTPEVDDAE